MRRLALAALLGLSLLSGCAAPVPVTGGPTFGSRVIGPPQSGETFGNLAARVLAIHNRERSAVGAPPLAWDPQLAAAAAAYGPMLSARGGLEHSPAHMRVGQGENLWMGTRGAYSLDDMVEAWASERRYFRPGTFPNITTSASWADVGHYTQMVWRGTTRVGCAVERSRSWDFLTCRYSPMGNIMGDRVP